MMTGIAVALRMQLAASGLTHLELEDRSGVPARTIARIMVGDSDPKVSQLVDLDAAFDVPLAHLFGEAERQAARQRIPVGAPAPERTSPARVKRSRPDDDAKIDSAAAAAIKSARRKAGASAGLRGKRRKPDASGE